MSLGRRAALVVLLFACGCSAVSAAPKPPAADAPFWTEAPDARRFAEIQRERLTRARAAIARAAAQAGSPTVDGTLRAYDDARIDLEAVVDQAALMEAVHPDSALREAAEQATRDAASLATELSLDRRVYDALSRIDTTGLDAATGYYLTRTLRDYRLAGVDRDSATRAEIRDIQARIVAVGQEFDRNIRDDQPTVVVTPADLAGLPDDFVRAHPPDRAGKVTLDVDESSFSTLLGYAFSADVRRRVYLAWANRAYPKNVAVLDSLIALRHRLAQRLGFKTYADLFTANKMIGSTANAAGFIEEMVLMSTARAAQDLERLRAQRQREAPGDTTIDIWDRYYWPDHVRRADYQMDSQALRAYFPYARVQQGVLDVTSQMFGVTYRRVPKAKVWHPSVECWEMFDGDTLVGRFYLDMHPRPNKYGHAAEFDVRTGVLGRQIPEGVLVCNLPGGRSGDPGLCEIAEVTTMFHEFGHLMHLMFSGRQRWLGVGGIRTEDDFIEAPSQMLEEWMRDPPTLRTFARHWKTGKIIPTELLRQLQSSIAFAPIGADPWGIGVRRQMVLAGTSLGIHARDPAGLVPEDLYHELMRRYLPYRDAPDAHFTCSFGHLNGYSAGYYTYMWSLTIAKDMFSRFDHGNLLDPGVARRYRELVLAPGGSAPAEKLVESFLGRRHSFEEFRNWLNEGVSSAEPGHH